MKLKHGRGFSIEEKCRLIPFINQQIIGVIRCISQAMQTLRIPFENPQNEVSSYISIISKSITMLNIGICTDIKYHR